MKHLAIDFGARRIGLAVSDEAGRFVSPYETRERRGTRQDVARLIETMRGLNIERVVFGLPRRLDGSEGDSEAALRRFAQALESAWHEQKMNCEMAWWDERFSTREALSQMKMAGVSQKRGRESGDANSTDARAAAIILQGFLDAQAAKIGTDSTSNEETF